MHGKAVNETLVHVAEWQYWLVVTESDYRVPASSGTGLVNADGQTAIITTGTDSGPVRVEWQVLPRDPGRCEPPASQTDVWTDVAEFSMAFDVGELWLFTAFDGPPPRHVLTDQPGTWRIRLHARGRDLAASRGPVLTEPIESHLLLLWRAPMGPIQLLRGTDEVGKRFGRTSHPGRVHHTDSSPAPPQD